MTLNLPVKMDFTMGSTEQKMDMTLDDIIKQTRKVKTQRVPIKGRYRNPNSGNARQNNGASAVSRAALQRSVAARSSNLRQGKFAAARARNGAGSFPATQAIGKRAVVTPVSRRKGAWLKNRRNNLARRPTTAQKPNQFNVAGGSMKISIINNGSKTGGQRFSSAPFRRRNGPNVPSRQIQTVQPRSDRMDVDYSQMSQVVKPKARTLDSLFAKIKEHRHTQPVVIQPFESAFANGGGRRGGRNVFPGHRRQGQ